MGSNWNWPMGHRLCPQRERDWWQRYHDRLSRVRRRRRMKELERRRGRGLPAGYETWDQFYTANGMDV